MPAPVMIPDNRRVRSIFPIRMPGRPIIHSWFELEALRKADIARYQAIAERNRLAQLNDPARLAREEREAHRKADAEESFRAYLDGLEPDPDEVDDDAEPEAEPDPDDVHVDEEPEVEPDD